jgi:thiamine-monophosphate kinase
LTLTVAGGCPPGRALTRAGAQAGDLLSVSGTLGHSRAGLAQVASSPRSLLARRQKRPSPRIALGLLGRRFASAAIDLSDGLGQDLSHLCAASKVGARVELASLPVSRSLLKTRGSREAAWREAAAGGEDYELLLAIPPRRAKAFERAAAGAGEAVSRVGALTAEEGVRFVDPSGRAGAPPAGHDHFG